MAIIRWDPFSELNSLHEQVNSLFNDTFSDVGQWAANQPATDIYSDEKELTIETHLPNFKEDEITVSENQGALEIKAEHVEKEEDKGKKKDRRYLVRESVNQYYRRFALPTNADTAAIKASFEGGVLKVAVPYKELPEPKRINIEAKTGKPKKEKNG